MINQRIAVNIAFFVNGFVYANWVSRLPRIQELYGADERTIALVLLSLSLGAVLAMPFAGWIIIRNGSRRITLAAVVLYCLFVPVIPFFSTWLSAIPLFFVMGAVTGVLDVAMNAQGVIVEQGYRRPIMTSFHAYFSIGMALGAGCGALFSDTTYAIFTHFWIISAIALLSTAWMFRHLIHDKPSRDNLPDGPLFRLPSVSLISIGIIAFCCMMGEGAMADWSVLYMEKIGHARKAIAPLALAAFAVAMTSGRIIGDKVRIALGDKTLIAVGGLASFAGLALALIITQPWVIIAGCFLVGLGLSTIVPITYSIAGNSKDLPSGVGIAMVTTVGYTGFLFGPPLIGFLAEWQTLRIALMFVCFLFLVMTVLGFAYKPK